MVHKHLKSVALPHWELGKWKLKPQKFIATHTLEWLKFTRFTMTNVARMWNN